MIFYKKPKDNFTIVGNDAICDPRLSAGAKGLLCYLCSKPEYWKFSGDRIEKDFKDGRKSIYTKLNELQSVGYLNRIKQPDGTIHYHLYSQLPKTVKRSKDPIAPNGNLPIRQIAPNGSIRKTEIGKKTDKLNNKEGARPNSVKSVREYFKKIGLADPVESAEAQKFFDHYESNGWRIGRNPMQDWKAAARNWQRKIEDFKPTSNATKSAATIDYSTYSETTTR